MGGGIGQCNVCGQQSEEEEEEEEEWSLWIIFGSLYINTVEPWLKMFSMCFNWIMNVASQVKNRKHWFSLF
jgi:hypothetical protein